MWVIKAGILDTFQDKGRKGYASLGVGKAGCMDMLAARLANILVGNSEREAVLEMHFPGPVLEFSEGTCIALTGADFGAVCNSYTLPNNRKIVLPEQSILSFKSRNWGQRCYLAVRGGWKLEKILDSYSTHLLAGFGGYQGRRLKKNDSIGLSGCKMKKVEKPEIQNWFISPDMFYVPGTVRVLAGPEWDWLSYEAQKQLLNESFAITNQSDRMGYRLKASVLESHIKMDLLSSGVLPGTIQLLPNGQLLLLMADCQTTGGYPRMLQVIEADLPKVAQKGPGDKLEFEFIGLKNANRIYKESLSWLQQINYAVNLHTPPYIL